jgi:hypothetical protein
VPLGKTTNALTFTVSVNNDTGSSRAAPLPSPLRWRRPSLRVWLRVFRHGPPSPSPAPRRIRIPRPGH